MELVGATGTGANMQQQQEPVQSVRVRLLFGDDAVEDGFRGNKILFRFARVVGVRARAGREIDERQSHLLGPSRDFRVVMLVRWKEKTNLRALHPKSLDFLQI